MRKPGSSQGQWRPRFCPLHPGCFLPAIFPREKSRAKPPCLDPVSSLPLPQTSASPSSFYTQTFQFFRTFFQTGIGLKGLLFPFLQEVYSKDSKASIPQVQLNESDARIHLCKATTRSGQRAFPARLPAVGEMFPSPFFQA